MTPPIANAKVAVLRQVVDFARTFLADHDAFIAIPLPPPDEAMHFANAARFKESGDVLRDAFAALDAHPAALRAAPAEPQPADEVERLREAAQDLLDFMDGGGFRANFPDGHFERLRAALAATEPADDEDDPEAWRMRTVKPSRTLGAAWKAAEAALPARADGWGP